MKQYFGIDIAASAKPAPTRSRSTPISADAATSAAPERARTSAIAAAADSAVNGSAAPERARTSAIGAAADSAVRGTTQVVRGTSQAVRGTTQVVRGTTQDVARTVNEAQPSADVRRTQMTPLSAVSSDLIYQVMTQCLGMSRLYDSVPLREP